MPDPRQLHDSNQFPRTNSTINILSLGHHRSRDNRVGYRSTCKHRQRQQKLLEMKKREMEKKEAEERIKLQEAALRENRERAGFSSKVNNVINKGTGLASQIINVDLRDMSQDFDALLGYANATYQKTQDLGKNFSKLKSNDSFFKESLALVGEALKELEQAANYYRLFYRSEDTAQEELRERIMRQKARSSYEKLKEASSLLASES